MTGDVNKSAGSVLRTGGAFAGRFGADLLQSLQRDLESRQRDDDLIEGTLVGPYRVMRVLGRGGMAVVYLAERADGAFAQHVALKLIKRGIESDDVVTRFMQERQILASFDHPNVARLLDGGVASDGRPFFAMELVHGEPIDSFCETHRLTIDERLDLLVAVGRAVQYAHRALVVHRDLKPSNILITPTREIKLLDFGIAKLLYTSAATREAPRTQTSLRVMTPEYASPEQIRGQPITTASDIYQLGLLMFELLTFRKAQPLAGLGPAEAERLICEQDPPRPSTIVRRGADAERRTSRWFARSSRSAVSSELDDIVLTALRKEPDRRYASVDHFVDDIMRFRHGLPIAARGRSWKYRSRKFVRRHAVALASGAMVAVLLASLITFYSVRLTAERDLARREAETANSVSAFAAGLFDASNPFDANRGNATARDLLERGADRIMTDLAGQPEVQARMMVFIGGIYSHMGMHAQALPLLERAMNARRTASEPRSPELAVAAFHLGILLDRMGRYRDAQPLLEEALSIRIERLGENHLDVAKTLNHLALLQKHIGSLDEAVRLHQRALGIQEAALGPYGEEVAISCNNLGLVYQTLGNHKESQRLFERALAIHERNKGADHPLVATTLMNLAEAYRYQKQYAAVRPLMERSTAIIEKAMGPNHHYVASGINSLANLLNDTGQYAEARPLYHRAIEIYQRALGPHHPEVGYPLRNLGNLHRAMGEYAEALTFYQRSLDIRLRAFGRVHPAVAQTLESVGATKLLLGDTRGAEPLLREALEVARKVYPAGHMVIGDAAGGVAWCLVEADRFADAEPLLVEAYRILLDKRGAEHAYTKTTRQRLTALYERWGKPGLAAHYRDSGVPERQNRAQEDR